MQREALIGLTVLLTLAVLGAGQQPEPAYAVDNEAPATVEAIMRNDADPAAEDALCPERDVLQSRVGPLQIQFVGSGESETASLKVQLDLAM